MRYTVFILLLLCFACTEDAPETASVSSADRPPLSVDYEDADYKWGFANLRGQLVIRARYDEVRPFGSNGLALVRETGVWSFISLDSDTRVEATGERSSKQTYPLAWPFSEGLAKVRASNDSVGFVNEKGEFRISPQYADAGDFTQGMAWVQDADGRYAIIDKTGEIIFPWREEKTTVFPDGNLLIRKNRRYGLATPTGEEILPATYKKLRPFAANGLAAARTEAGYGYLDRSGNWIIEPDYLQAGDFTSNRAVVLTNNEEFQLIDATGRNYLSQVVNQLWAAGSGRWIIEIDGQYGAIDSTGKTSIPLIFDELQSASEGFMAYRQGPGWGFVNADNSTPLTPPAYALVWPFKNGFARVATRQGLSVIDTNGQLRLPPVFLDLRDSGPNGLFPVQVVD